MSNLHASDIIFLICYSKVLYPNTHLYTESFKKKQDTEGVAIFSSNEISLTPFYIPNSSHYQRWVHHKVTRYKIASSFLN